MMNKIIAFVLTACMLFSMCGCALSDSSTERFQENSQEAMNENSPENTPESTEKTKNKNEFSLGEFSGKTYENHFSGIGFNLPDGWRFYSEEELKALNQVTTEAAGEEYAKLLEEKDVFYDMMASSSAQMENVNITLEKSNALLNSADMKTIYQNSMKLVEDSLGNMGATDIQCELSTAVFDGEVVEVMYVSSKLAGFDLEQMCMVRKANDYIVTVNLTSTDKAALQNILDSFYVVD